MSAEAVDMHHTLQPAMELQRALRKRLLGIQVWELKTKARREVVLIYSIVHCTETLLHTVYI
jgi:hypothetical protein